MGLYYAQAVSRFDGESKSRHAVRLRKPLPNNLLLRKFDKIRRLCIMNMHLLHAIGVNVSKHKCSQATLLWSRLFCK